MHIRSRKNFANLDRLGFNYFTLSSFYCITFWVDISSTHASNLTTSQIFYGWMYSDCQADYPVVLCLSNPVFGAHGLFLQLLLQVCVSACRPHSHNILLHKSTILSWARQINSSVQMLYTQRQREMFCYLHGARSWLFRLDRWIPDTLNFLNVAHLS